MKHTIDISGLPEGLEPVAFRLPHYAEKFWDTEFSRIDTAGHGDLDTYRIIIKKKQPRRIVLEETSEIRCALHGDYIERLGKPGLGFWEYDFKSSEKYRIWREVKESDLSLNNDEPKLSFVPKVGEYFRIEHQSNDRSYRGDIFLCTASDGKQVVCDMASRDKSIFTDPFIFISNEWNFYPVTEEALVASGIKKDEPKLSLSVDECKALLDTIDINVVRKMQQFLKDK